MSTQTALAKLCAAQPGDTEWITYLKDSGNFGSYDGLCDCNGCQIVREGFDRWKYEREKSASLPSLPSVKSDSQNSAFRIPHSALDSLIHRIAAFQTKTFPRQTLQGKLNHLAKEAKELADCAGTDPHEWADVLNLLIGAALLKGWTFSDLVRFAHDKMAICEQREWPTEPGPDGCYHHIK